MNTHPCFAATFLSNNYHQALDLLQTKLAVTAALEKLGATDRELDGFINPHGLWSRVVMGAGAGRQVTTLEKPTPVAWV